VAAPQPTPLPAPDQDHFHARTLPCDALCLSPRAAHPSVAACCSNSVDKAEWRNGLIPILGEAYSHQQLDDAFDAFDADGTGAISYEELKLQLGVTLREAEAEVPSQGSTSKDGELLTA
jgi:hypothetical protein